MDQRHQEYIEYYQARLKKYENNPLCPHTAAAERALFEAISTASSIEEFGERVKQGKLNIKCAIALVRDQETARANLYKELEEHVRAGSSLEILQKLDSIETVEDLNTMVTDVETRWHGRIAADETTVPEFWGDWKILEDIECDEKAQVPEQYRPERQKAVEEEIRRGTQTWNQETIPNMRKFVPDYEYGWDLLWETRHRRLIPVSDDVLKRRIEDHKRYVGAK